MLSVLAEGSNIEFKFAGTEQDVLNELLYAIDEVLQELANQTCDNDMIKEIRYGEYARNITDNIEAWVKEGLPNSDDEE